MRRIISDSNPISRVIGYYSVNAQIVAQTMYDDCFESEVRAKDVLRKHAVTSLLVAGGIDVPPRICVHDNGSKVHGVCVPFDSSVVHFYVGQVCACKVDANTYELKETIYNNKKRAEEMIRYVLPRIENSRICGLWQIQRLRDAIDREIGFLRFDNAKEEYMRRIEKMFVDEPGRPGKKEVRSLVKKPRKKKFNSPF